MIRFIDCNTIYIKINGQIIGVVYCSDKEHTIHNNMTYIKTLHTPIVDEAIIVFLEMLVEKNIPMHKILTYIGDLKRQGFLEKYFW